MPKPYNVKDTYFLKAKIEGYRARSAYKLLEIQEKFHVLKRNQIVLDLGGFPGSFSQVIAPIVTEKGMVISIDLQQMTPLEYSWVHTYTCDIYDQLCVFDAIYSHAEKVDVIVSDMAPNTSGIADVDQHLSKELNDQVLRIAKACLKKKGTLVTKIFMGSDFKQFLDETKKHFETVKCYKPKSSRDRSKETFIVCKGFKA
jgi:23S rRNA (uridine2552-2'-O)-methyltransferase